MDAHLSDRTDRDYRVACRTGCPRVDDDLTPRPPLDARHRRRRRDRRRRVHRPLDRVLPGRRRSRRCGSRCSRRRSPGSARPAATAAGARRCSRSRSRALARRHGRGPAIAMHRAMQDTVDEVGRVAAAEGIDCDFAKGGTVVLARSALQLRSRPGRGRRVRRVRPRARPCWPRTRRGPGCGATSVLGGTYTPDCARDPPGQAGPRPRRRGAPPGRRRSTSRPGSSRSRPGAVATPDASGSRPTSWYARPRATPSQLPGLRRAVAPVYSLMVATEPLPAVVLGRGRAGPAGDVLRLPAPDHLRPAHRRRPARVRRPRRAVPLRLGDPAGASTATRASSPSCAGCSRTCSRRCGDVPVAASWGGPLGVPRDWYASVGLDRATGLGWAGGYVGDGVAHHEPRRPHARRPDPRREHRPAPRLPWVGHRSPRWEPEPLRWLGRQRRAVGDDRRRPGRGAHRPAVAPGRAVQPVARTLIRRTALVPLRPAGMRSAPDRPRDASGGVDSTARISTTIAAARFHNSRCIGGIQ